MNPLLLVLLLASSAHGFANIEPQDISYSSYAIAGLSIGTTTLNTSRLTVYGIITSSTPIPTISCSAGTGVVLANSGSQSGTFNAGIGATACTLTFQTAFPKVPICFCQVQTVPVALAATATASSVTCTAVAALTGDVLNYFCWSFP